MRLFRCIDRGVVKRQLLIVSLPMLINLLLQDNEVSAKFEKK